MLIEANLNQLLDLLPLLAVFIIIAITTTSIMVLINQCRTGCLQQATAPQPCLLVYCAVQCGIPKSDCMLKKKTPSSAYF